MTKKQVRYGTHNLNKASIPSITERQIAEICLVTGETKNDCVQAAITERYMRIVHSRQERKISALEEQVLKLEAALRDAIG